MERVLHREGRSLFQYLREVPPWVSMREENALAEMITMGKSELAELESMGRNFQRRFGEMPKMGRFPDFTPYNDMALNFLLPKIVAEQKQLLADLEADRGGLTDSQFGKKLD